MARSHEGPDDAANRLTGSASPEQTPPEADAALREAEEALRESDAASLGADGTVEDANDAVAEAGAALQDADAVLAGEADAVLAGEAETTPLTADATNEPPYGAPYGGPNEPPPPAVGRAAVGPESLVAPPADQVGPAMRAPATEAGLPSPTGPGLPSPTEPPTPPPPIESYQELLGGLGERPYDSPRRITPEAGWGRELRRFARRAVWTLPVAAICFALSGMWGWPTRTAEPAGESPGTWLVVTVLGLILALVGVLAVTALLSATAGRGWSIGALVLVLAGSLLVTPVLGVMALARPSVSRTADRLGPDAAVDLENRFFDNAISRWLGVGGLILIAAGWLALGCAVLASGVLNRVDGYLVLCAVAIAVVSAYMSWQFLITVAAMVVLAAGLGLAWTAARLTPDGRVEGSP